MLPRPPAAAYLQQHVAGEPGLLPGDVCIDGLRRAEFCYQSEGLGGVTTKVDQAPHGQ
jgi:hypothetical protein